MDIKRAAKTTSRLFAPRWQGSLANAHRVVTSIVNIGSSTTAGLNASPLSGRWTDVMGTILHRGFGSSATGGGRYIPATDASATWATSGTITTVAGGFGLQSKQLSSGATMTITVSNCTGIEVHYADGTGLSNGSLTIDGGGAITLSNTGTGSTVYNKKYTGSTLTRGTHTFVISTAGTFVFNGIYVRDTDLTTGVRSYTSGKSGATVSDHNADTTLLNQLGALTNVSLVNIELGPNEWAADTDPATFGTDLTTYINTLQSTLSASNPDICLVINYKRLDLTTPLYTWDAYAAQIIAVAAAFTNVYVMDMRTYFPTTNDSTHDPQDLIDTDGVHMTTAGHAYYARLMVGALTLGMQVNFVDALNTFTGTSMEVSDFAKTGANGVTVYNTSDRITNTEYGQLYFNSNVLTLTSASSGSGTTLRDIELKSTNRSLHIRDTGSASGAYSMDIHTGQAGANGLVLNGQYTASSGTNAALSVAPTINASGSEGYVAILANVTETATGSGNKRLLDLQVGSTTKVYVRNDGVIFPVQAATASAPTYTLGGMYYDTTLNKLRIGGASGWETVTST